MNNPKEYYELEGYLRLGGCSRTSCKNELSGPGSKKIFYSMLNSGGGYTASRGTCNHFKNIKTL